jgi:Putative auto-transporter adhesin, head GIN domain
MNRILVASLVLILLAGCTTPNVGVGLSGSGNVVNNTFDLIGFSQIDTNSAVQVQVTHGDSYRVEVQVDDNLVSHLDVGVTGTTLHIRLQNGSYNNFTLAAQITLPELTKVTMNGASTLNGDMAGEDLSLNLNGASRITLTGTAGRLKIVANGASRLSLGNLAAESVNLDVNGASRVEINASGAVTGTANGASVITVSGSPTSIDIKTEGASQVITE